MEEKKPTIPIKYIKRKKNADITIIKATMSDTDTLSDIGIKSTIPSKSIKPKKDAMSDSDTEHPMITIGSLNRSLEDKKVVNHHKKEDKIKNHYCYILRNHHDPDVNRTYNGYTVNPKRRIRQHNQEIKGGAKYTKSWGEKSWEICVLIKGFPDHHNATQCEWKIKRPARKRVRPQKYNSPEGRVIGLNEVLQLDRWTGSSTINNKDFSLKIWVLDEYAHLLTNVPDNIEVISVPVIDFADI